MSNAMIERAKSMLADMADSRVNDTVHRLTVDCRGEWRVDYMDPTVVGFMDLSFPNRAYVIVYTDEQDFECSDTFWILSYANPA